MRAVPILSIRNLTIEFRTPRGILRAVDGVHLDIYEGEAFGLIGESGCGKSVLANAILRIVAPNGYIKSGSILFRGKDILALDDKSLRKIRWEKVSMIFQSALNCLNPVIKIKEHIIDTAEAHKKERCDEIVLLSSKLLELMGLNPERTLESYPFQLSGGMKQRVVAVLAFLLNPELVILDEPITALDILTQAYFVHLIKEIHEKRKNTILFITHDIPVISGLVDRVGVMYLGNIIEIGNADDVLLNPLHPYTKALIESIPQIIGPIKAKPIPGPYPDPINPPSGCKFHPRCPYAMDVCKKQRPQLVEVEKGRLVACHLYTKEGETHG